MIVLNAMQGSMEWNQARSKCFNASEAPAMMGVSQYMTRTSLLRQKATGIVPEVDAATQARFDMGHAVEALARPLVEEIIGEELYPIVATDDSGKYLASSDGATMLCNIGFEHKALNKDVASQVDDGNVPDSHRAQLDHQFMVFGFDKIIFVCSDGTRENLHYCWYYPQQERIDALKAGWEQFEKDLANYQHSESKHAAVAEVIDDLPALSVQLIGQVTASNLDSFKTAVTARIQAINTTLVTDSDFATADKMVKFLDDGEKRLDLVKAQALSQTASIDELFRTIDGLKAEMRSKRLTLDKLVKAEKESRKAEIVLAANKEIEAHVRALWNRVGNQSIPVTPNYIFTEAIKGLKSLDSMRDKISVALADAKITANSVADRIDANRKTVDDMSLFPDFASVCTKLPEDFAALLAMRVNQRNEAEAKRLEQEREKIRAEEQAKAQREAAEALANQNAALTAANQTQFESAIADAVTVGTGVAQISANEAGNVNVKDVSADINAASSDCLPRIKLGEINARLGVVSVTADQLEMLGFKPVATDKNAKLYEERQFATICRKIQEHLGTVMMQSLKKAA